MHRLWETIVGPLINKIKPHHIVEVGCEYGHNTKSLLEYCDENNAQLTSIDPYPLFDVEGLKSKHNCEFELLKGLSLEKLATIKDYDMILLDGDHNWYTIYHELKLIEKEFEGKPFPLTVFHDISWPYGRRDLYYNPDTIPKEYLNPYAQKGISPNQSQLVEIGGINSELFNAVEENTPRNGVLTGIEDFLNETELDLTFKIINAFHGLGILYPKNPEIDEIISEILLESDLPGTLEKHYLNEITTLINEFRVEIEKYDEVMEIKDHTIDWQNSEINKRNQEIAKLKGEIKKRNQEIAELKGKLNIKKENSTNNPFKKFIKR